jgi:YqaJ-like viral recombinase domain
MYAHVQQHSEEWHYLRKHVFKLTCSEYGKACGVSSYGTRNTLLAEKMDPEKVPQVNSYLQRLFDYGTLHEKDGIECIEAFLDCKVVATGYHTSESNPVLAGSPDGLVEGNEREMVEIKVKTGNYLPDKPDPGHLLQVLGCLEYSKREICYLCYWHETLGCRIFVIRHNSSFFNRTIVPLLEDFLKRMKTGKKYNPRRSGEAEDLKQKIFIACGIP